MIAASTFAGRGRIDGAAGGGRGRMSDEARELHRIIRASVRDMLDAYRVQALEATGRKRPLVRRQD